MLITTTLGQTRIHTSIGQELRELSSPSAFSLTEPTLCAKNLLGDFIAYVWLILSQVTPKSVSVIVCKGLQLVSEWNPPTGLIITKASINPTEIVVSTGGGGLFYFQIANGQLREQGYIVCLYQENELWAWYKQYWYYTHWPTIPPQRHVLRGWVVDG